MAEKNESWFSKNIWKNSDTDEKEEGKIKPKIFNKSTNPSISTAQPYSVASSTTASTTSSVSSEEIGKYREHIKGMLRGINQQGPDYFEFAEALETNSAMNLERNVTFVVTYNSLKSLGLTKDKLVSTGEYYINSLTKELSDFKLDREKRKKSEVEGRETDMTNLQTHNQQLAEQIKKLSDQMNSNNARIEELTAEKVSAEQKLNQSTLVMETQINEEISRIKNDLQTIQIAIK